MPGFTTWLDTFVSEKALDREHRFTKTAPGGTENSIPLRCVLDAIKSTSLAEQVAVKTALVQLDFHAADPMHYFDHLAGALAFDIGASR